ncbi:MAG: hypothetical protein ACLS90_04560 [Clostridia bacterium]
MEKSTKIDKEEKIELGKAEKLSEGNYYTIVAIARWFKGYEISNILKKGIGIKVINARFLKTREENIVRWIGIESYNN